MKAINVRFFFPLLEAVVVVLLFAIFGYFTQKALGLSIVCLMVVSIVMSRWIISDDNWVVSWGIKGDDKHFFVSCLGAFIAASILAYLYRNSIGYDRIALSIQFFATVAMAIGTMEEFIFRGSLFARVKPYGTLSAILFTSGAHTIYKASIFWGNPNVDIRFLTTYTALIGILLGSLRNFSGSIWPCVIFHALFDLLVYGDCTNSPWWVW